MSIIPSESGGEDRVGAPAPEAGEAGALRRLEPMPDNDLALNLVRTTEAAALGAARWVGRGDKNAADQGAVDSMRLFFNAVPMDGVVVIGEGEKDEAPMLYNGEHIGTGSPPEVDVAVDPIDGTRLVAQGQANALSVVAVAGRGAMFNPGPCVYMEKIVAGREAAGAIDIAAPIEDNIRNVALRQGTARQRRDRDDPRPPAARGDRREGAEDRGAGLPADRRRRRRRDHRRAARHGCPPALRHRRHARGRRRRRRAQVPGRRDPGRGSTPATTGSVGPPSTPATTSTAS